MGIEAPCSEYLVDVADLNQKLAAEQKMRADVTNALEFVTMLCYLKKSGFCFARCPGGLACKIGGLTILDWPELPESVREVLP